MSSDAAATKQDAVARSVRWAVAVALVAALGVLVLAWWAMRGPRRVPAGQPPLAMLTQESLPAFRAAFNAAADRPRLLLMLSPT